jgi:hypothetical protein
MTVAFGQGGNAIFARPFFNHGRQGTAVPAFGLQFARGLELLDQRGGAGEERGAAADGGAEGLAEMAERGVADFHRGLGHVVAAGEEQLSGAFHADLAHVLRDGHAHLFGEKTAQVE